MMPVSRTDVNLGRSVRYIGWGWDQAGCGAGDSFVGRLLISWQANQSGPVRGPTDPRRVGDGSKSGTSSAKRRIDTRKPRRLTRPTAGGRCGPRTQESKRDCYDDNLPRYDRRAGRFGSPRGRCRSTSSKAKRASGWTSSSRCWPRACSTSRAHLWTCWYANTFILESLRERRTSLRS